MPKGGSFVKAVVTITTAFLLVALAGAGTAAAQTPVPPAATWTCSASALRVTLLGGSPIEPVTGNPANSPCVDSNTGVIPLTQVPNALTPLVTLSAVFARTDVLCASDDPDPTAPPVPGQPETDNNHCDAGPPITQQVVARAGAADATINIGGLTIRARLIESTSRAYCDPTTNRPAFQTDSKVVELTINDQVIQIPQNGEPFVLDVGLVRLVLNERIGTEGVQPEGQTSGSITRRALHVSLPSNGSLADVVVGESRADYTGDTCPEGKVVIKKETAPDENPNTTDFGFSTTGGLTPSTFTLRDDGTQTFNDVRPGTFSVSENAPVAPYSLETIECTDPTGNTTTSVPNRRADIDVQGGETVTCTFTNRRAPQGTVVIRKQTSPDEDPNTTDFGFSSTGGLTPSTFTLRDDGERVFTNVAPGAFTVTEDAPTGAYSLESIDCIDPSGNTTTSVPNRRASINVAGGETVTCTFTNRKAANGTVIIRKQTNPDEDPNTTDFGFTTTGLTPAAFSLRDDGERVFNDVAPGPYSVTENAPSAPYSLDTIECVDATGNTTTSVPNRRADINVGAGETVICTFTNRKALNGTIVVKKETTPDENPNATDFGFSSTGGLNPPTFTLRDDGQRTFTDLTPGAYSVTEDAPTTPYQLTVIDCVDPTNNTTTSVPDRRASINVAAGETVTCTFVNFRPGPGTVTCPSGTAPDANGNCVAQSTECPAGTVRNPQGQCVVSQTACPEGTARNPQGQCIATNVQCPAGTTLLPGVLTCQAAPTGGAIVPLYRLPNIAGPCRNARFGAQFAILGTNGPDRITGSNLADRIFSFGGNDRVSGGRGDDCVQGGSGNDVLDGSNGNDYLLGESGRDQLSGGPGRDLLYGGSGNDRVRGDAGNDTVRGSTGNDKIRGGDGNDLLIGGSGNDGLHTGNGRDRVFGGSGNDIINAATRGPAAFVDCGPGNKDRVRINNNERNRIRGCEFVDVFRRIRRG